MGNKNPKSYPRVLTIAGSDSGGGAGIQADLKTFSALGCYGMSVITALTAQNTLGVTGIHPAPDDFIRIQGQAVLSDIGAQAVKIGMLHSPGPIGIVAGLLDSFKCRNVVLDPVMVAAGGDRLIQDETIGFFVRELFPRADVITPNLQEAEIILGRKIVTDAEMTGAAIDLSGLSKSAALLKGGGLDSAGSENARRVTDYLAFRGGREGVIVFTHRRISTANIHGAGCTLSSAIAAFLARGFSLRQSVQKALDFVHHAIAAGAEVRTGGHGDSPDTAGQDGRQSSGNGPDGHGPCGHGPLNHFFKPRKLRARRFRPLSKGTARPD